MTTEIISSLQNDRIKRLVKLRERRHRRAEGVMVLDEIRMIVRALDAGFEVREAYFCSDLLNRHTNGDALTARIRDAGAEVFETTQPVLEKAAYRQNPEGVVAVAEAPDRGLSDLELPANPLVIVLENVEKPGNLGAVLRTASGVGAHAVLACGEGADPWNPNCLRASTGAVFSVPVVAADRDAILDWLRERGVQTVAAAPEAELLHTQVDATGPIALLLGAEDRGLTPVTLDAADLHCRIPMLGSADSLNVSVSAAVLAYEVLRQRSAAP